MTSAAFTSDPAPDAKCEGGCTGSPLERRNGAAQAVKCAQDGARQVKLLALSTSPVPL